MEMSNDIVQLSQALLKAQKEIKSVIKDSTNPFFKSKYATLEGVIEACKKPLNDNGIVVTQLVDSDENHDYLTTMLIHAETGQFLKSKMKLEGANQSAQVFGSFVTYAKRYSLQSLTFLPSEDEDGNIASGKFEPKVEKKSTRVEPKKEEIKTGDIVFKLGETGGTVHVAELETKAPPTFSKKALKDSKAAETKKEQPKADNKEGAGF